MSEKQFKLSSETVLQYQIMDNDTDLNENEVVDLLNELSEENKQLKKDVENLQEVVAELGATLLINGFEIKINNENLSELIDDEDD